MIEPQSYWEDSSTMSRYTALDRDLRVDVVVIGAGITGLTAAYLLKRSGLRVAVIDRRRAGGFDSGLTTAHVTHVTDERLSTLVSHFGQEHAQAAWDAGRAAIAELDGIIEREEIECEWTWVSAYLHSAGAGDARERNTLDDEARLAAELGFEARYLDAAPFVERPAIEYAGQAKFHPRKYLSPLAKLIDGNGSHVFEHTESEEVGDDLSVKANGHTLTCGHLVIATHTPLTGKTNTAGALTFQTKQMLYTSYAIGGRLPKGIAPEASYWDTADPYHYLRIDSHRDYDYAIYGGEDHKTGQQQDTAARYRALEQAARALLPKLDITHRWSGQVVETNDGLPYIGETAERQFAATGYAGNGMTFGTLAGLMACDYVTGRKNPWRDLFDPGRRTLRSAWDYVKENADYPYYMLRDRLTGADATSLRGIGRGEGRIVDLKGARVAAYRGDRGTLTLLSATCTHLGCDVAWNGAERTWDCPCHGSRFAPTGAVLSGPAESPLEEISDPRSGGRT